MNSNKQFDQYVEKIVLKNKLVPEDQLQKINSVRAGHPEYSLLDVLLRSNLISQKHATLIMQKYQTQSASIQPDAAPASLVSDYSAEKISQPIIRTLSDKTADDLESLLIESRKNGASDLYINVDSPPVIRKNGKLDRFDAPPFTAEQTSKLLFASLTEEQKKKLTADLNMELCLDFPEHGRYRSCYLKQSRGWEGSFRIIEQAIPTFESLGLPKSIKQFTDYTQGLVLVTGPSGSGKSSSLAAMIDLINQKRENHIITLEDPIEFKYTPIKSHISQREVGSHTRSFSNALRAALREDPDVILVGEMRDLETASLAVTAAETGHLVFSTLHTIDAAQTVMRLLDFFPPSQQNQIRSMVSESLRGIVCQRLIPRADNGNRVIAFEILMNIPSISSLIRDDKPFQIRNMMRINQTKGMCLMDDSVKKLLEKKVINHEDAHHAMIDSLLFQQQRREGI